MTSDSQEPKPQPPFVERRKAGRPKMQPEDRLSIKIHVVVTPAEADAMYSSSRRLRRPLADLVREACRRYGLMTEHPTS
jgi:hypothetical protein